MITQIVNPTQNADNLMKVTGSELPCCGAATPALYIITADTATDVVDRVVFNTLAGDVVFSGLTLDLDAGTGGTSLIAAIKAQSPRKFDVDGVPRQVAISAVVGSDAKLYVLSDAPITEAKTSSTSHPITVKTTPKGVFLQTFEIDDCAALTIDGTTQSGVVFTHAANTAAQVLTQIKAVTPFPQFAAVTKGTSTFTITYPTFVAQEIKVDAVAVTVTDSEAFPYFN